MCMGAMIHARVSRVVFGANDEKTGACGSCQDLSTSKCFNHSIDVLGGVLADESSKLLKNFFRKRRK